MTTKDNLINIIKQWVLIDNEILGYQKKVKELRTNKKDLSSELIEIMKSNEIDCFDLNDGKIIYSKKMNKAPLNKKTLMSILSNYYNDVNEATTVCDYLLTNREEKVTEGIRRKINK